MDGGIAGDPSGVIGAWIKGVKFMDWTEPQKRHPDKGGIGLQVHGGGDFTKQYVRYRNIRIKALDESKHPWLVNREDLPAAFMAPKAP